MSDTSKLSTCQLVCWGLSAIAGLAVLWSATGAVGFVAALLLGVAFAVFLGLVFGRLICTGYKAPDETDERSAPAAEPTASVAIAAVSETAAPAVKSGTLLKGEEELSARKGAWHYGEPMAPGVGDEGNAETGTRPELLSAPRDGKADDLTRIKGVGPKLEKLCHELGIYHFDQIAAWTATEVDWVDENLKGFKGRVSRDNWVEQAKALAAGGKGQAN
ncbi:NADH:ubiquinone oxidoreductase [Roseovarius autotrophicus]|uniref:NADH:ubiquinone oxidoreductase n=1 Tax=Roseovarius autotrophicus TaxID=2824121 RepID=UPI001A0DD3C0|nr:NADH:ubiquinone oxidoreductase [Roseovarius autotrophicus]MBE0452232.1 NADH:ubiquinone oxidoreductase [Roseovarius sp.]